jgi:5-methyltetrahydropteroyltriglutamate--homocysteine methyltransferase
MRRSEDRILTTHTGSLPPPPELTRLYVRQARGESVDLADLEGLDQEAWRSVLRKQAEAGSTSATTASSSASGYSSTSATA